MFALVDRLAIGPDLHQRIVDTVEICYREAGEVIFESAAGEPAQRCASTSSFSARRAAWSSSTPEPSLFSFNTPAGACPRCQGFGNTIDYDMDLRDPRPRRCRWTKARSIRGRSRKYRSWLGQFQEEPRAARCA